MPAFVFFLVRSLVMRPSWIFSSAVRKIKVGLEPPTGCSITALRPPVIKLEAIRSRFSSLQSTITSGWQALRNIRVAPRVPANGSFSRQSLAYVQAGTQYIKQVSGLLKTGVTTLRSNSSSYEVVQGKLMESFTLSLSPLSFISTCLQESRDFRCSRYKTNYTVECFPTIFAL